MRSGISLRDVFDGEGLRRLARQTKDAAHAPRLLAPRRSKIVVAEQNLDDAYVGSAFQKMGGKAVAQRMDRHLAVEAGGSTGKPAGRVQDMHIDGPVLIPSRKQPDIRSSQPPIGLQNGEQLRGDDDRTVLAAFAGLTRITPRPLSISPTLRRATSDPRSPAA